MQQANTLPVLTPERLTADNFDFDSNVENSSLYGWANQFFGMRHDEVIDDLYGRFDRLLEEATTKPTVVSHRSDNRDDIQALLTPTELLEIWRKAIG